MFEKKTLARRWPMTTHKVTKIKLRWYTLSEGERYLATELLLHAKAGASSRDEFECEH